MGSIMGNVLQAKRASRSLDLGLMDLVTWPEYVWDFLAMEGDSLASHQWQGGDSSNPSAAVPHLGSTGLPWDRHAEDAPVLEVRWRGRSAD